jgi:hypothetical protein
MCYRTYVNASYNNTGWLNDQIIRSHVLAIRSDTDVELTEWLKAGSIPEYP